MQIPGFKALYPYLFLLGNCIVWYAISEIHTAIYALLIFVPILIIHNYTKLLVFVLLGSVYAVFTANQLQQWQFPANQLSDNHLLIGHIEGMPESRNNAIRFRFRVSHINHQNLNATSNVYLRLSCYRRCPTFKADQKWQLLVRLKAINGYVNPAGFDFEKWLYAQRIKATGYIVPSSQNRLLNTSVGINTLRQKIRDFLLLHLEDPVVKSSAIALVLGDKSYLQAPQQQLLAKSGLSHLLAISGLHIGLSAIPGFWFAGLVWRRVRRLQQFNRLHFQWLVCLIPALCYTALSGFGLPACRALVMLVVFAVIQMTRNSISTHSRFCCALWFILLTQPLAPLQVSFWLSFCVTAILIFLSHLQGANRPVYKLVKLQSQLFILLLPLQLFIFNNVSLLSPVYNFIAIPFVTILMLPLLLLLVVLITLSLVFSTGINSIIFMYSNLFLEAGVIHQSAGTGAISLPGIQLVLWAVEHLLSLFWSVLSFLAPYTEPVRVSVSNISFFYLLVYPLVMLLLFSVQLRLKILIVLMLCLLLFNQRPSTSFRLLVLDVGQGLAITVEYDDKLLIYDAAYGVKDFAVAQMTLLPWLNALNHNYVSLFVVSHNDADHAGGIKTVMGSLPVLEMLMGPDVEMPTTQSSVNRLTRRCHRNQHWQWSDLTIQVLSPEVNHQLQEGNDSSCVLLLQYKGVSILLTGDIEIAAERQILHNYPNLTADILLVPHHGSKTSSSPSFLQQLQPKIAIISSGYLNRFNHPANNIVKRYQKMGVKLLNTAYSGAIEVTISEQGKIDIRQWRKEKSSLWRRH